MGNGLTGTPLTQTLVYCQHHGCPDMVDCDIVRDLIRDVKPKHLDIEILSFVSLHNKEVESCSILEMAIDLQRMDIVKTLVKAGANPIYVGADPRNASGIVQLFNEYYGFGTNHYISWLLHEHLPLAEIPNFIDQVMNAKIFNEGAKKMFEMVGRHPAHALLTCGHEEMSRKFLEIHGYNQLTVVDGSGKTALQIAAEKGDLDSVKIILSL